MEQVLLPTTLRNLRLLVLPTSGGPFPLMMPRAALVAGSTPVPSTLVIIIVAVVVALIVWLLAAMCTRRKDIKKVAYMMDALEDGELNFRFKESNKFNRTLNRIRTIFEMQRPSRLSREPIGGPSCATRKSTYRACRLYK